MTRLLQVFLLCAFAPWTAFALADPLDEVSRFASDLTSYRADFEQTVISETGGLVERSSGEMVLAAPNRLRWHYLEDYEQLIVADGTSIWSYDVDLEQVTVKSQSAAAVDSPLYVLLEPAALEERYELRDNGRRDGLYFVELIPRAESTDFESIELGLRDNTLESLSILDAFGQQTLIRFSRIERNPEVDDALFRFDPPAGIDVIGDGELGLDEFALPDS